MREIKRSGGQIDFSPDDPAVQVVSEAYVMFSFLVSVCIYVFWSYFYKPCELAFHRQISNKVSIIKKHWDKMLQHIVSKFLKIKIL